MYLHILHITYISTILKSGSMSRWGDKNYRGQKADSYSNLEETNISTPIYKEHNNEYLLECIENLAGKGIKLYI